MKIVFVHSISAFKTQGGAEVSLRHLMKALIAAGHECVMLVTGRERGLRREKIQGVEVIECELKNIYPMFDSKLRPAPLRLAWHAIDSYNWPMAQRAADIIDQQQPDIVSLHNLAGWSAAIWPALAERGYPLVQVLHDQYALCASSMMFRSGQNCQTRCYSCRALRLPHPRLSRYVTAVVGVSRFVLERHRAYGMFKDAPIERVIHNARSAKDYDRKTPPGPARERSALRFGYLGSINESKGVAYLCDAFEKAELPEAELLIAGSLDTNYARSLAAKRTSDARVRFLGRQRPAEFFARIDALVLPSLWHDTFPGVVLEALIFGCPVIAVNHGGAPEIVRHAENGLLFDMGAPDTLANCLEFLARRPDLRARMSQAAYRDGQSFIDVAGWAKQYETLYRETIATAPLTGAGAAHHDV